MDTKHGEFPSMELYNSKTGKNGAENLHKCIKTQEAWVPNITVKRH